MTVLLRDYGLFSYYLGIPWADLPIVLAGAFFVVKRAASARALGFGYWCLLSWLAIQIVGILAWTPFRWDRWFLPVQPVVSVLEAIGVLVLLKSVFRFPITLIR